MRTELVSIHAPVKGRLFHVKGLISRREPPELREHTQTGPLLIEKSHAAPSFLYDFKSLYCVRTSGRMAVHIGFALDDQDVIEIGGRAGTTMLYFMLPVLA